MLHETEAWWTSYATLATDIRPSGRTIYDLGQVAHVHCLGASARLLTDDTGLESRYGGYIGVVTVASYRPSPNP